MIFYKTLGLKNSRIDVADALRGLAVAGIILYHSVEHFNMYDGSIAHAYTLGCDDWMADVLALLLSGKMYGIYLLLVYDEGKTYTDYLPLHTRNAGGQKTLVLQ